MNNHLPLAFPDFIYAEPTLAPGGGAEVVSLANPAWFANNGFSLDFSCPTSFSLQSFTAFEESVSTSAPFGFDLPDHQSQPQPPPRPTPLPDLSILRRNAPPPPPIYSASGFDLLSILARVATRPNPKVILGSVDLKCSFVVVDTRRFDHPIIYCSPSFCTLTGYSENEIIGRNCRFLQAPDGNTRKGVPRNHTSEDAVAHLRKSLVANKECQTSIRNFRKDGSPFMNLLTVIPLSGGVSGSADEENDYVYHVGFQVDLAQQPNAILEKSHHGSYLVNYSPQAPPTSRRANNLPAVVMSKELRKLIADPRFITSIPLSTATILLPQTNQDELVVGGPNHLLHLLLLEVSPDFIHVVSLKGNFLYVAPSVRRVLGFEPEEMVGKSISDFAHPKDVIPLMRELKESSATGSSAEGGSPLDNNNNHHSSTAAAAPRTVNLLFRARTKMGKYVWVESRGRLHVEPGKGRKAIVLSGRAREMSSLTWDEVRFAGGLARGEERRLRSARRREQEVWGMISGHRRETVTFLSVGKGVEEVLGWSADELIGRNVMDIVLDEGARNLIENVVANMRVHHRNNSRRMESSSMDGPKRVHCALRKKGSGVAVVWFVIYRAQQASGGVGSGAVRGSSVSPVPLVYQIRLVEAQTIESDSAMFLTHRSSQDTAPSSSLAGAVSFLNFPSTTSAPPPLPPPLTTLDMFEELAISKASSWQYELQQLRFANVRLREELVTLQVAGREAGGRIAAADKQQNCLGESTTSRSSFATEDATTLGRYLSPPVSAHQTQHHQEQLYSNSLSRAFH